MKYDVYFHNDLDGRASAAVMLAFLQSRGDDIVRYRAMTYGYEAKWLKSDLEKIGNPAIIVDFTYHPKAAWWFDHHASAFKDPKWKKTFRPDKQHQLDSSYLSCTHLIYEALKRDFNWKPPRHFADLVKWLDRIDAAKYPSAKSTIEMRDPALLVNAYVEALSHSEKEDERLIKLLAGLPFAKIVKTKGIATPIKKLKREVAKSLAFYKKNTQLIGHLTFIDVSRDPLHGLLRYAPQFLYPKTAYGIRAKAKGSIWYLGVGANPWNAKSNPHDLGSIMKRYGGGGHRNVGAGEFKDRKAVMRAFGEINVLLNRGSKK